MGGLRRRRPGRQGVADDPHAAQAREFWSWIAASPDPYARLILSRRTYNADRPVLGLSDANGLMTSNEEDPLLALGPGGSGKSSSLTVVNVLMAPGPVVSTSSRPDVYLATSLARGRIGRVWSFSPNGEHLPNARECRWSALQGCESYEYAGKVGKRFADQVDVSAVARAHDTGGHPFFRRRAGVLLAALFFYAATHGKDMEWVYVLLARGNAKDDLVPLAAEKVRAKSAQEVRAAAVFEGITTRYPGELSGIMSTAAAAVECYSTDAALRSQRDANFNPKDFVRGEPDRPTKLLGYDDSPVGAAMRAQGITPRVDGFYDSVFIADGDSESPAMPIYIEFVERIREASYEYAKEREVAGLDPALPVTLVLDELAACPIPTIGRILADSRRRQTTIVGGIQTLKQAEEIYGRVGADFLTIWRYTMAYRGILDTDTLETLSLLSGDYWAEVEGRSQTRHPRTEKLEWTSNISLQKLPRLTPDQIRLGHPRWDDGVLLVRKDSPHQWIHAVPYYKGDPWLRVLVNSAEHAVRAQSGFPIPPLARDGNYSYLDQLGLAGRLQSATPL